MGFRLRIGVLAALLSAALSIGLANAQVGDAASAIAGRWRVVNVQTGAIVDDCAHPQVFAPTADGRFVDLSAEHEGEAQQVRYVVLQSEPKRALMFILSETRPSVARGIAFDGDFLVELIREQDSVGCRFVSGGGNARVGCFVCGCGRSSRRQCAA